MKKTLVSAALLGAGAVVLAGCAGGTGSAGSDEGAEIRVWLVGADTPQEARDYLVETFEEDNPGSTLVIEEQSWEGLVDKLTTSLSSSDSPDIVEFGNTQAPAFTSVGALLDLSDEYEALGGDDLLPGFVEAGSYDGAFYAPPLYSGARVVFADPALVTEAPATLDDYIASATALAEANPGKSGIYFAGQDWYNALPFIWENGGETRPLWETLRPDVVMGMAPFTREQLAEIRGSGVQQIIPPAAAGEDGAVGDLGFADGPRLQVNHLLERGRRQLAFAASPDPRIADLVAQRRELARKTLTNQTGSGFVADATFSEIDALELLREWIDQGVDGVVAYNDDIAALLLGAALRSDIAVPEQLAIVGHDDTPLARLLVPALSTVRVDNAGLGRFLAELALSAATGSAPPHAGPETDVHLVVRETT